MNIQCQQCGTSYAVADEKVRGRLMKVRCKSCNEVIRVDGTILGAADGSSAPPALSKSPSKAPMSKPPSLISRPGVDGAIWHIAVGDGTQGPYTLDELREYYAQGSVLLDTLVYREGFEEWTPAGEVPELAAPSQAQSHTQAGALAFAGGVSMGSDPFGERAAAKPQASKSPRVSASEMLDENVSREHTVQFSLDQIRALSSVSQPSPLQASPSIAPPRMSTSPGTGYASGDGSGLIDVRKLAELHAASMAAQESPRAELESSSLIPSHSSYAHTLAPLSLPLPPSAAQNGGIDSKTKLIAGLAAFGMVLAAAVGVLALTRPQPETQVAAAAQPVADQVVVNSQPAEEPKVAAAEEEEEAKPEEVAKADKEEAKGEDTAEEDDSASASRSSSGKRSKRNKAKAKDDEGDSEPVAKADKKEEKKEKASAKESIDDLLSSAPSKPNKNSSAGASIDDLLDSAVSGKKSAPKPAEKPAADSSLPQTPSRDAMLASLGKAKAKAAKCKGPGVATAAIQIAGSGKVSSVTVSGAEGAAASCVEKAVRSTPFPKFQKDSFEVKFPFKLGA